MQEFIRGRRDISKPPGKELKDYEEYANLYRLAWSDDDNRWLLSTVLSAMIFDDHDDARRLNASLDWKKEMEATSWCMAASWPGLPHPGCTSTSATVPHTARAGRDLEGDPRAHRSRGAGCERRARCPRRPGGPVATSSAIRTPSSPARESLPRQLHAVRAARQPARALDQDCGRRPPRTPSSCRKPIRTFA